MYTIYQVSNVLSITKLSDFVQTLDDLFGFSKI